MQLDCVNKGISVMCRITLFALAIISISCNNSQPELRLRDDIVSEKNIYTADNTYELGGLTILLENNLPVNGYVIESDTVSGITSEVYYFEGRKHGEFISYFNNGSIHSEGQYLNGKEVGVWAGYHRNGRKNYFIQYSDDGLYNGIYQTWFKNGQLDEFSHYKEGLRIGWQRGFTEDGTLMFEGNLVNGNGVVIYYDETGKIVDKVMYISGKETNPEKRRLIIPLHDDFHDFSGEDLGTSFKYGMRHGIYKIDYSADIPEVRGEFFFGQRNGTWKWWYENGQLKEEIDYDRGILLSIKCWDENGKSIGCDSSSIPSNEEFLRPGYVYRSWPKAPGVF